jgi:hypothetical protein
MVKMNLVLIIDLQDFGMMYEHLKVVEDIRFTFGIILSPKLGNGGPSSPSFGKPPQRIDIRSLGSSYMKM